MSDRPHSDDDKGWKTKTAFDEGVEEVGQHVCAMYIQIFNLTISVRY